MALQDLTPQLRTRLSRVERAVGLFVSAATLLLLAGFSYYIYRTAAKKGWFETKAPYFTYVNDATGLKEGGDVKMMGFGVGKITKITAEAPGMDYNVYVEFYVQGDYIGYVWTDSRVKVISSDFLGGRYLEILKGGWNGYTNANGTKRDLKPTYEQKGDQLTAVWMDKEDHYAAITKHTKPYWLLSDETPALAVQAEKIVGQATSALPSILSMTNQVNMVLKNITMLTSNLDVSIAALQPVVSNVTTVSARLTGGPGALGDMLLPANLNAELRSTLITARGSMTNLDATIAGARQTLASAENTMANVDQTLFSTRTMITNTDENVGSVISNLNLSLIQMADITSNLSSQVQVNTNILSEISSAIVSADVLMQGLKKHWLLRSAFKTNAPKSTPGK